MSIFWEDDIDLDGDLSLLNGQVKSSVTGLAPFIVASSLLVANLNVEQLDSHPGAFYLDHANMTGRAAWNQLPQTTPGLLGRHSTGLGNIQQITLGPGLSLDPVTGVLSSDGVGQALTPGNGLLGDPYDGSVPKSWQLDFGTGANQAARGNHNHDAQYRPIGWTPTLQNVLDAGNIASKNIFLSNPISALIAVESSGSLVSIGASPGDAGIGFSDGSNSWQVSYSSGLNATLNAGNQLRVQQDPIHANDLARKAYVDAKSAVLESAGANTWFGNSTAGAATPAYNSLAALTRTNDTNITLTLGGTPASALAKSVSMTLGWTGQLAISRGGTGLASVGSSGQLLRSNGSSMEYFTHDFISSTLIGAANGIASLDGSGKVPLSQLPVTGMQYMGEWNAGSNSPALSNGSGTNGHWYRVTTPGTVNFGAGNISFIVGDAVIYNGSVWQKDPAGAAATNLALGTLTSTTIPITNSNGSGFTLPSATITLAGLLSAADKVKLNAALTSFTETDPTVPAHVKSILSGDITNWNGKENAFSKGDIVQGTGISLSGTLTGRLVGSGNITINATATDQNLYWNPVTGDMSIDNGTGVNLDGRYFRYQVGHSPDLDVEYRTGQGYWNNSSTGPKPSAYGTWMNISAYGGDFVPDNSQIITQLLFKDTAPGIRMRTRGGGAWSAYVDFATQDWVTTNTRSNTWVPSWTEVTGKPSTFAPSAHTIGSHSDASVSGLASGQLFRWNGSAWANWTPDFAIGSFVTTNTNQSGLGGKKEWTGDHTWTPGGANTSTNNAIMFGLLSGSGPYITLRNASLQTAVLRSYAGANNIQLALSEGTVSILSAAYASGGFAYLVRNATSGALETRSIGIADVTGLQGALDAKGGGTVSSVNLTAPTGFNVGSPVTTSGNIVLSYASGYSLPTNAKQAQWDRMEGSTINYNSGPLSDLGMGSYALYANGASVTDRPGGINSYVLHIGHYDNNAFWFQLATPYYNNDKLYTRNRSDTGVNAWRALAYEAWVTAQNYVTSATLGDYVTLATSQTITGSKTLTGTTKITGSAYPHLQFEATGGKNLAIYADSRGFTFTNNTDTKYVVDIDMRAPNYSFSVNSSGSVGIGGLPVSGKLYVNGQVDTVSHGNSAQWNAAYSWVNTYGTGLQGGPYSQVGHTHSTLTRGSGLTGGNYNGGSAQTWAFDTSWGDARYSQVGHAHATLNPGTGISGNGYNGGSAQTWSISFGTSAGQAAQGNDYRINNGQAAWDALGGYVPTGRTITINGVTQNLGDNRSWTIGGGISGSGSWNRLPVWTGGTSLGNSEIYRNDDGNYGIGGNADYRKLRVYGEMYASGAIATSSSLNGANLFISSRGIIGGGSMNGAAAFQVDSNSGAVLPTRLSTANWDAISGKPEGLFSWDADANAWVFFNGSDSVWFRFTILGLGFKVGSAPWRSILYDI